MVSMIRCRACNGLLYKDEDVFTCRSCGRHRYFKSFEIQTLLPVVRRKRAVVGGIGGRNINAVINSQYSWEKRWRANNRQTIDWLNEGRSVSEIATLSGKNPRHVRNIAAMLWEISIGE